MVKNEIIRTYDVGIQWEYKTVCNLILDSTLEKYLNELGEDGWNLILSVQDNVDKVMWYIFKRPKR